MSAARELDRGDALDRRAAATGRRSARSAAFGGRSICVTSPETTIFEPAPIRVRNIFICETVVFCASSRMMNASFERAAAHVGQRNHLDQVLFRVAA